MSRPFRSKRKRLVQVSCLLVMPFLSPVANTSITAQTGAPASQVHRAAPNFSRMDLSRNKIELTSYRGKVVLLNFWATWCGPCLIEMPTFIEWQRQYGSAKFQVIGVSMDDAVPEVVETVSKLRPNYPILMGDEHLGEAYGGVLGLPVTFVIDRRGTIYARYVGATDLARIKGDIENLLRSR